MRCVRATISKGLSSDAGLPTDNGGLSESFEGVARTFCKAKLADSGAQCPALVGVMQH